MQDHVWDAVEALHLGKKAQKAMTAFERTFIADMYTRGHQGRMSSKQCRLVLQIEAERAPNLGYVRLEYNSAVAQLKQARTPEDLRARLDAAIALRCRLLDAMDPGVVPIVTHNLAEAIYHTLIKELPPSC